MIRLEDVNEGNWRIPLAVSDEQNNTLQIVQLSLPVRMRTVTHEAERI